MSDSLPRVDEELKKYQQIQDELSSLAQMRNHYYQKANENGMVKKELDLLKSGSKVFKIVGPVLLNQELEEAKVNVTKRIEFIQREMSKIEKLIEEKSNAQAAIGDKIAQIQGERRGSKENEETHSITDSH